MKQEMILVVDDKDIVDFIEVFLGDEGYKVLKAYHGNEALTLLNAHDVDLVILDIVEE